MGGEREGSSWFRPWGCPRYFSRDSRSSLSPTDGLSEMSAWKPRHQFCFLYKTQVCYKRTKFFSPRRNVTRDRKWNMTRVAIAFISRSFAARPKLPSFFHLSATIARNSDVSKTKTQVKFKEFSSLVYDIILPISQPRQFYNWFSFLHLPNI